VSNAKKKMNTTKIENPSPNIFKPQQTKFIYMKKVFEDQMHVKDAHIS